MKAVSKIVFFVLLTVSLSSCNDFFEIPVTSDITLDSVFSSRNKAQRFLWTVYETGVSNGFPGWRDGGVAKGLCAAITDECILNGGESGVQAFCKGTWGPNDQQEFSMADAYKGIRNANIFLENAYKIPEASEEEILSGVKSQDVYTTAKEKSEMMAEARFFRAYQHFTMMERYGGIPIVTRTLSSNDDMQIPRSTLETTLDFIVSECDSCARVLPNAYINSVYRGRVTKGAALALKARALLYAASPLFNPVDGKAYYEDGINDMATKGFSDKDLVCLPYSHERWKAAADAAKAVIDWAEQESGWCAIDNTGNPFDDYNRATSNVNSNEVILNDRSHQTFATWGEGYGNEVRYYTNSIYGSWKRSHGVTFNFTKFYLKADGTEQTWNEYMGEDVSQYGDYEEFKTKCKEMEPRFQVSVMYSSPDQIANGLESNKVIEGWWNQDGTKEIVPAGKWMEASMYATFTGVGHLKKYMVSMTHAQFPIHWIMFRLAEQYLNYAEALNEYSGPSQEVLDALNVTRKRAGLPIIDLSTAGSQENLREMIHRERNVELLAEEHRMFDVRRWKIADQEGVLKGGMYILRLHQQGDGTTPDPSKVIYKKIRYEDRGWQDCMYLYPFDQSEMNLGYLVQNPGW